MATKSGGLKALIALLPSIGLSFIAWLSLNRQNDMRKGCEKG